MMDIVGVALGEHAATLIEANLEECEGKQVCRIWCEETKVPVYLNYRVKNKELVKDQTYVRYGSISKEPPRSEWDEYCKHRFERSR